MVEFGSSTPLLGTSGLTIGMKITAWVLALLTIPLHIVVVKYVPCEAFAKCLELDLENNDDESNCLTKRISKYSDKYNKLTNRAPNSLTEDDIKRK